MEEKKKKYVGPEIADVEEKMSKEEIRERFDEETAVMWKKYNFAVYLGVK